jgi:serine protease
MKLADAAERGPKTATGGTAPAQSEARVIVKFKADSSVVRGLSLGITSSGDGPQLAQSLSTRLGLSLTDGHVMGQRMQVLKGSGVSSDELARQLSAQSDVEYAVVDGRKHAFGVTINDPLYLNAAATQTPAAGRRPVVPAGAERDIRRRDQRAGRMGRDHRQEQDRGRRPGYRHSFRSS